MKKISTDTRQADLFDLAVSRTSIRKNGLKMAYVTNACTCCCSTGWGVNRG